MSPRSFFRSVFSRKKRSAESDAPELDEISSVDTPPEVPADALEDIPPAGEEKYVEEKDPGAAHQRELDRSKLRFGQWLIFSCLGVVVILSGVQYGLQDVFEGDVSMNPAIDLVKLIATTALGFVFARTREGKE